MNRKIVIGNMEYFKYPGTEYYINIDGDIYSGYKHKILTNNNGSNSIRITIKGKQRRIKIKDALIDALFDYIINLEEWYYDWQRNC